MEEKILNNRQDCNEILFKKFLELAYAEKEPEQNRKNILLMLEIYKTLFFC